MSPTSLSEEIRRFLNLISSRVWLLILIPLLSGLTILVVSLQMTPIYRASTMLLVNEAPAIQTTDYSSILTSERLTQTYAQMLTTQPVLEGVISSLGLEENEEELKRSILVQPVRDTQLIEIQVENPDPYRAAAIANALVNEFTRRNEEMQASRYAASKVNLETELAKMDEQIQASRLRLAELDDSPENQAERDRLEENLAQYRQSYANLLQSYEQVRLAEAQFTSGVIQVEIAKPPSKPVRPYILMNIAISVLLGLLISVGVIVLLETLNDTLRYPEDATALLRLPVLGVIARLSTRQEVPIMLDKPRSPVSEAYRSLRTSIQFASVDRPLRTLLVTSPSPEEGKSSVSSNLAVAMAQNGRQVLLIDGDLRNPSIHRYFGLDNVQGLSDLFVQEDPNLDDVVKRTTVDNLYVLPSGVLPPNPSELLGSEKMNRILFKAMEQADMIIVDSPPLLAVTDAAVLAHRVDGVIVVVKPWVTKMGAARQIVEALRRVGANVLGLVLNEVEFKRSRHAYYQYYGYYYACCDDKAIPSKGGWQKKGARKPVKET